MQWFPLSWHCAILIYSMQYVQLEKFWLSIINYSQISNHFSNVLLDLHQFKFGFNSYSGLNNFYEGVPVVEDEADEAALEDSEAEEEEDGATLDLDPEDEEDGAALDPEPEEETEAEARRRSRFCGIGEGAARRRS